MNLSTKTYRWDVEEIKSTGTQPVKLFTLYDWEVFGEVTVTKTNEKTGKDETYKFDKKYLKDMVEHAQKEEETNYFLPVHTKHKDKDKNGNFISSNESAGVVKGIRLEERDGESVIIAGQWTKIPEHIFRGILEYQWKYRSVEMNNYDNRKISSVAILDIEPPEFKFPITEVNVDDKEIPQNEAEHPLMAACGSFSENNEVSLFFRESKKQIDDVKFDVGETTSVYADESIEDDSVVKKPKSKKKPKKDNKLLSEKKMKKETEIKDEVKEKDKTKPTEKELDTSEDTKAAIKMGEDDIYEEDEEETDVAPDVETETEEFPETATDGGDDLGIDDDIEDDDSELLTVVMEFTQVMAEMKGMLQTLIGLLQNPQQAAAQTQAPAQDTGNPTPMQMSEKDDKVLKLAEKQKNAIAFMELRNDVEKMELKFTEIAGTNYYKDTKPIAKDILKIVENHKGTKAELAGELIKMSENYIGSDEWHEKGAPESAILTFKENSEMQVGERIPKDIPSDLRDIPNIAEMRVEFEKIHPELKFSEKEKDQQLFFDHMRYRKNISTKISKK